VVPQATPAKTIKVLQRGGVRVERAGRPARSRQPT
jgi:hypothetical protein